MDTAAAEGRDDRIIRESGTEARVAAIVAPALSAIGFRLVRVRILGQNGAMTIEDCEEASRALSAVLDVEDPIEKAYNLEVSSPGIDRPLVRRSDFEAAVGHLAKVETSILVENRKRFRGKIMAVTADGFTLESDKASYGEDPVVTIPFETLDDAKLILTDDLIREALRKDKQLRKENKRRARSADDVTDETGDETGHDNDNNEE
jgi:ribosome maturation factor RimP